MGIRAPNYPPGDANESAVPHPPPPPPRAHVDLLARIEAQAVEIDRLKRELAAKPDALALRESYRRELLREMARGAVNCGPRSGCALAARYLDG